MYSDTNAINWCDLRTDLGKCHLNPLCAPKGETIANFPRGTNAVKQDKKGLIQKQCAHACMYRRKQTARENKKNSETFCGVHQPKAHHT